MCVSHLMPMQVEGMSISTPLLMITLGMVLFTLCIGNPMAWINSRNFKKDLENQLGEQLMTLQYDQGEEYMSSEFDSFIKEYRIISQLSVPRTLQQNGVAKIRNQILMTW